MNAATNACPKLRDDLVVSRRDHRGKTLFVVSDPRSQRFFHFGEPEIFIARQLDGATSLDAIRGRAEERFESALPDPQLRRFVASLNALGLLERAAEAAPAAAPRARRVRGSLLYLRWKAFDPDRLLETLERKLRILFRPSFVALSAGLILLAMVVLIANHAALARGLPRLARLDAVVVAWFTLFVVTTLHELAHGLTCKHFGGHVHEMGFMLIFFQPAMYCNVSDAWLFPQKSQRLWVTFAGAYFEMFLWALATLVWRATDPATLVNFLALLIMLTSGIKTLFNLNPLVKLDGYYLLADLVDVPNLNARAWAFVRGELQRWLGWGSPHVAVKPSPRERRIFLVYGILAGAFSLVLLGWVLLSFGTYLTGQFQATGFLLTVTLGLVLFRRPLAALLARPIAWAGPARLTWLARVGVAAAVPVVLLGRLDLTISAPLTILPARHAEVRAEVDGIVEQVFVDENQRVQGGREIMRLRDRGIFAELRVIDADIAAARARLKLLEAGARPEETMVARREVETAQTRLVQARSEYESGRRMRAGRLARRAASVEKIERQLDGAREEQRQVETLVSDRAGAGKELREATLAVGVREQELAEAQAELRVSRADDLAQSREAVGVAERQLMAAQSRLDLLLAGTRHEELEATRAKGARLEAQRDYRQQQYRLLHVASPIAGVITTPKLPDRVGQVIHKGDLVARVQQLDRVRAEVAVPEQEIADVRLDQKVVLKARAFPGQRFEGRVVRIAAAVTPPDEKDAAAGRTVLVTAELDNPGVVLKSEMTGHAKISCGERRIIDLLTRRLVRYLRVEFWSWW